MITTRLELNLYSPKLPTEIEAEVASLENHLARVTKGEVLKNKSRAFQGSLADYQPRHLNVEVSSIRPALQGKLPANLRLDKVFSNSLKTHFLNIELCFNNRESAGTNFLKLSAASEFQKDSGSDFSLGLLLVPKRELLDLGGWDSSYGDSTEYSFYYKEAFQKSLFGRFLIIELSGSFLG